MRLFCLILLSVGTANAFITPSRQPFALQALRAQLPSADESAKALSDYMAKSHEEKLKAVKEVETKKNAEIAALKEEIESLRNGVVAPSALATTTGSTAPNAELQKKLESYQQFMANYIVKAQEEKARAIREAESKALSQSAELAKIQTDYEKYKEFMQNYIVKAQEEKVKAMKEAEDAVRKKYGEQLVLASPTTTAKEQTLYDKRNEQVLAAAKANKSRWGDMETARVAGVPSTLPANGAVVEQPTPPSIALSEQQTLYQQRNQAVSEAAKAGKSRWGEMEAERASNLAAASTSLAAASSGVPAKEVTVVLSETQELYQQRNQLVSAAAKAGKSRWGEMEVERVDQVISQGLLEAPRESSPSPAVVVTPEIEAADHGLRSQDAVPGPTLAERVNLGSALYQERNAMVAAAAQVGVSRWGDKEVERVQNLGSAMVTPEIEAADHGLRADGGVGGPTLAERVNLGAQLVA